MRIVILVIVVLSMACASKPNSSDPRHNLYVYGDSISQGLDHPNYAENIAAMKNFTVINKSIGGTKMDSNNQYGLMLYDAIWSLWEPNSGIMYAPGVNDAILMGSDQAYQTEYRGWLNNIALTIRDKGQTFYIGTPNHTCDEARFVSNSIVDQYAQINRDVVKAVNSPGVRLIDYNSAFIPTSSNTLDCYHPNKIGYQQMTEILLKSMF